MGMQRHRHMHPAYTADILSVQLNRVTYICQSWLDPFQTIRLLDIGQNLHPHSDVLTLTGQAAPQTQKSCLDPFWDIWSCIISCLRVFIPAPPLSGNSLYLVTRVAAVEVLRWECFEGGADRICQWTGGEA